MMNQPKKPKVKNAFNKRTGAPKKGFKYSETTTNKLPNPTVEPAMKKKMAKLKPMRSVASGSNSYGQPTKTVKMKTRSL